jgi:hypothetical protein
MMAATQVGRPEEAPKERRLTASAPGGCTRVPAPGRWEARRLTNHAHLAAYGFHTQIAEIFPCP